MLGTVQDCSAWSGPYNAQLSMTVLVDPAMQQDSLLDMDGNWKIAENSELPLTCQGSKRRPSTLSHELC